MKKIFLIMMLMVAATATMSAQDELEQTAAPSIYCEDCDGYFYVTIENSDEDPGAVIYFSIYSNGELLCDWTVYDGMGLTFDGLGVYDVSAYAQAPGKSASEVVTQSFVIEPKFVITEVYDFIVDGIYYKQKSDSTVWVTTRAIEECINDWSSPIHAAEQCYSGDVIIPGSVEYDGVTYTVTGIDNNAFEDCNLGTVDLPNTIESINDNAFDGCTGLTVITIPESVTKIGQNAFWWCSDLNRVICKGLTPPNMFWTAFWYQYERAPLFVPNESLEAYRAHNTWGRFTSIVPFIGAGPGDINGDGTIAIGDVSSVIDMLLEGDELPAYCDVNGDGIVSIADVSALIDILLGF